MAFLLIVSPVIAQESGTAYEALRVIGTQMNRSFVERIISVTGDEGNPQPATWKVLLADRNASGGVREVEVTDGRIAAQHTPVRPVVGSSEGATIKTTRLNLDSSGAYAVASHIADKSSTQFQTVSYTLRTDEHGDPVWIVTLHAQSGQPVGTIFIGANRGTVTRTEGMFSGATMQDVQTDHVSNPGDDEEGIPAIRNAKARIKETFQATFHRAQDEARNMFDRVRRSFVDFINRA